MTHRVLSDDEASNDSQASAKTTFLGFCKSWTLLKRREPFNNHVFGSLPLLLWMSYPKIIKTTRGWKLASFLTGTVIMSHDSSCCSLDCISVETFACIGLILKYQISQKEMKKNPGRAISRPTNLACFLKSIFLKFRLSVTSLALIIWSKRLRYQRDLLSQYILFLSVLWESHQRTLGIKMEETVDKSAIIQYSGCRWTEGPVAGPVYSWMFSAETNKKFYVSLLPICYCHHSTN